MRKGLVLLLTVSLLGTMSAWAWGNGHGTVARETLMRLPGTWGERLRADRGLSQLFLRSSHAPDDQRTLLSERAEYFDDEMLSSFPSNAVMFTLHNAASRVRLLRAIARAMKRGDARAVAFGLSCYTHGVADVYAPQHGPLVGLACSIWNTFGAKAVEVECDALDKDDEGRALLQRIIDSAVDVPPRSAEDSPDAFFDDLLFEPVLLMEMDVFDEDHLSGGRRCRVALAHEAARGVWSAVRACEMAERWASMSEVPRFDGAACARRAARRRHDYLARRPLETDAWVRGVMPKTGHVFETGVVYDSLGSWLRGMMYISSRVLAVQVAASLAKKRDAGIVDLREVLVRGVPDGMKTLVVIGSGLADYEGFSKKSFLSAVCAFRARGGRLLWIAGAGGERPPREIFPEADRLFLVNPIKSAWGDTNGPVPAGKVPGSKMVLPDGRSFVAVRRPKSHWDQFSMRYVLGELPKGASRTVELEAQDGTRATLGFAVPGLCYLPTFAIMPYVFTSAVPSISPLVLSLDEAGEAVVNATLDACTPVVGGGE